MEVAGVEVIAQSQYSRFQFKFVALTCTQKMNMDIGIPLNNSRHKSLKPLNGERAIGRAALAVDDHAFPIMFDAL